jgi:NAD(P)-dependent dehydrogenase (short-subunit alcohol dehydrogenase family)
MKKNLWQEFPEDWSTTYNTDVTVMYFSTVAFLPLLQAALKSHASSVIVISSMSGLMRHSQAHFAYNNDKGATAHLSKIMSKEFASTGIRVNSIAPGYFLSEMTMKESDGRNKVHKPDEKVKDKGHEVPRGKGGFG